MSLREQQGPAAAAEATAAAAGAAAAAAALSLTHPATPGSGRRDVLRRPVRLGGGPPRRRLHLARDPGGGPRAPHLRIARPHGRLRQDGLPTPADGGAPAPEAGRKQVLQGICADQDLE